MAFPSSYGSSSPPSTPAKSPGFGSSGYSTTPAGQPPSSSRSFAPGGDSFSSPAFGSSIGSEAPKDLLSFSTTSTNFGSPSRNMPLFGFQHQQAKKAAGGRTPRNRNFTKSKLSYSFTPFDDDDDNDQEDDDDEEDSDLSDKDADAAVPAGTNIFSGHVRKGMIYSNPQNAKRARLDETWVQQQSSSPMQLTSQKSPSAFPGIARDIASRHQVAAVDEPSGLILGTEDIIGGLYDVVRERGADDDDDDDAVETTLSDVCEKLSSLWVEYAGDAGAAVNYQNGCIGPAAESSGVMKASFLASLLLQLHHPPMFQPQARDRGLHPSRSPFRSIYHTPPKCQTPIPKVLFDWISKYHSPQSARFNALKKQQPNPTASPTFWNTVLAMTLRADFPFVIELLELADFTYARTAMEEGSREPGYHGRRLQTIQQCVNKAQQLLRSSPSVRSDDWDIKGMEWALFRKQVAAAISELEDLAEGADRGGSGGAPGFQASHFGLSSSVPPGFLSFSQSARMAESGIPWSVYQHLRSLYGIVLGDVAAILKHSDDWVEATVGLSAWWSGDDDSEISLDGSGARAVAAAAAGNPTTRTSVAPRVVDVNTEDAYLRRLDYAFTCVTETLGKDGLRLNSLNACEVGLASVFEGNVEGVLRLAQTWSVGVAAATAEVASFGGWLEAAAGAEPMRGCFNESERMVLGYGGMGTQEEGQKSKTEKLCKDDVLVAYSAGLRARGRLETPASAPRDGWELALEVLSRLDDREVMKAKVNEFLDGVAVESLEKMDRLCLLCTELGYQEEGRRISERYGDNIAETTEDYGTALFCYARAHCSLKIKNVTDMLVSLCLVQSAAYPPAAALDAQLRSLLYEPTAAFAGIAAVDAEGAALLQFSFSGYATLRHFYDIRDGEPRRPLARKRAAAQALAALIGSAADSIYGGLYDPDRKTAVQVDGLLVLLGEALALVAPDPNRHFTGGELRTILAAIEDLQTVTARVYEQCEACLRSALAQYDRDANNDDNDDDAAGSGSHSPPHFLRQSIASSGCG
ncbi:hypothetical protein LOY97_006122, partial [Ophidiomyces ophidiicola]